MAFFSNGLTQQQKQGRIESPPKCNVTRCFLGQEKGFITEYRQVGSEQFVSEGFRYLIETMWKITRLALFFLFITVAVGSMIWPPDSEVPTPQIRSFRGLLETKNDQSVPSGNSPVTKGDADANKSHSPVEPTQHVLLPPKRDEENLIPKKGEDKSTTDTKNNTPLIPPTAPYNNASNTVTKIDGKKPSEQPSKVENNSPPDGNSKEDKSDEPEPKKSKNNGSDKTPIERPKDDSGSAGDKIKINTTTPRNEDPTPPGTPEGSKGQPNNIAMGYPPGKKNEHPNTPTKDKLGAEGEEEPPPSTKIDKDKGRSATPNDEVCDKDHSCEDKKNMIACLRAAGNEMQELSLLIQNKGDDVLHVKIKASASLNVDPLELTLEKQKRKTVKVLFVDHDIENVDLPKIVIDAGNGECTLDVPNQPPHSPDKRSFFEGFSYSAMITPIFGVYLLVFTVLAIGGTWMCCKFRGRRRHGDSIRYQELEMSLPETNLPVSVGGKPEVDTDGWDEVWDDNWEDAEAARSSSRTIQSLSSKGLAVRRSNKDGWDNAWDE